MLALARSALECAGVRGRDDLVYPNTDCEWLARREAGPSFALR